MGFWSTLGKIGKVAAPIAASFIPGLGPIASKLVQAGVGAGSGFLGGGGKMGALQGGMQGAMQAKNGGLGPSGGFMGPQQQGGRAMNMINQGMNMASPFIQQMAQQRQQQPQQQQQMPQQMPQQFMGPQQQQFMPRGQNMRTPNLSNPFEQGANEGRAQRGLGPRRPTMY